MYEAPKEDIHRVRQDIHQAHEDNKVEAHLDHPSSPRQWVRLDIPEDNKVEAHLDLRLDFRKATRIEVPVEIEILILN